MNTLNRDEPFAVTTTESVTADEARIDEILADSFPASDPPSWTLGVVEAANSQPLSETMTMNPEMKRSDFSKRDAILKLLSDEETARVSTMEGSPRLADGTEYIDLENLDHGVQRVHAKSKLTINQVLTRNAVHANTWTKICATLAETTKA